MRFFIFLSVFFLPLVASADETARSAATIHRDITIHSIKVVYGQTSGFALERSSLSKRLRALKKEGPKDPLVRREVTSLEATLNEALVLREFRTGLKKVLKHDPTPEVLMRAYFEQKALKSL